MKQTKYFNIQVPELGDSPDITQVSNAISGLEDALAGTTEFMNATVSGTAITLASATRATKRTNYHDGMTFHFTSPVNIASGYIKTIKVDNLTPQTAEINFEVASGETLEIVYGSNKFVGKTFTINKSNSITSTSVSSVATSNAVKQVNDKTISNTNNISALSARVDRDKVAKTTQVVAGAGLTGGGALSGNVTLNVVATNDSINVTADGISANLVNSTSSTSTTQAPTANAVKLANDNANTGISKADTAQGTANTAVSKANTAQSRADSAYSLASTANTKADGAQSTANTGVTNAGKAQKRADDAYALATTAKSTADTGVSKANTAQAKADSAYSLASTANSKADTAKGRADSAYSLAGTKMSPSVGNNVLTINGWQVAIV